MRQRPSSAGLFIPQKLIFNERVLGENSMFKGLSKLVLLSCLFSLSKLEAGEFLLEQDFKDPLVSPRVYQGAKRIESRSDGTFCEKYQNLDLKWQAGLDDVTLDFLDDGTMAVHFVFSQNSLNINLARKGGILCSETQTHGQILLDQAQIKFRFFPAKDAQDKPKFRIDDLRIEGLHLGNFEHEGPWGIHLQGDLPDDMANWVSDNFNSMMAWFLTTSVAERLTDYLSDKLIERIGAGGLGPL
jgi:hypothetical protein